MLRLLRTNPRTHRVNPVGLSVQQDGEVFHVVDADGNIVSSWSSKRLADAFVAKKSGQAITMERSAAPAARAPAPAAVPTSVSSTDGDDWAVVDEKARFVSAAMTRKEADALVKKMLAAIGPSWDPWDRGLEIVEEGDYEDYDPDHALDMAQERAEEEWEEEAEDMRRRSTIRVVTASEARQIKQAILSPSRSQASSPTATNEPWPGYSGHGRGGFGGAGGWGPYGGRGGWGGS